MILLSCYNIKYHILTAVYYFSLSVFISYIDYTKTNLIYYCLITSILFTILFTFISIIDFIELKELSKMEK